ncbi:hypothetical protein GCM10022245_08950 [Streptomyces mayteni]
MEATRVVLGSVMVPLTRISWVVLLDAAEVKALADVTVTTLPPAPPVVARPKPVGVPTATVSTGSAATPLVAVRSPPSVTTAVITATALPSLNRALVLRMGFSVRSLVGDESF